MEVSRQETAHVRGCVTASSHVGYAPSESSVLLLAPPLRGRGARKGPSSVKGRCVDRCAIFVDAGYLFAAGGLLCHGSRSRAKLALDDLKMVEWLETTASADCELKILRTYWYDGARSGIATAAQKRVASRPGVKLRLGRLNQRNEQKGVDALIYRDLITLATERAITDAYLLSGDEDLREGVKAAQDRGVRVVLIGIPAPSGYNQSEELCHEVDDQLSLDKDTLSQFLLQLPSTAPPSPLPTTSSDHLAAARTFAEQWAKGSSDINALLAGRPAIPRELDVELLIYVEKAAGISLRDDQDLKRAVRKCFWDTIDAIRGQNLAPEN